VKKEKSKRKVLKSVGYQIMDLEVPVPETKVQIPKIRVSTFNLLDSKDVPYIQEIVEELSTLKSDIVSIHGCTRLNFEHIIRAFKQYGYQYTRFDQMHTRSSGEIMFYHSSVVVKKKEYTNFVRTAQSRGVSKYLVSTPHNPDSEVWVITSQLEAGSGNGARKMQIAEIKTIFESTKVPVIFAGDTNIPSWQDLKCPEGWFDAWREKGTVDNEKTTLLDRMDQVWFKSNGDKSLECIDFSVVCNSSERKGVLATFEILS